MTKEQLLSPRYKVIALYPGCKLQVGEILYKHPLPLQNSYVYISDKEIMPLSLFLTPYEVEPFPNIFRLMEWWEERSPQEMPDYIKIDHGGIIAFFKHLIVSGELFYKQLDIPEDHKIFASKFCSPSTEEEYTTYINQQK